ncbi:MAG: hypothetical protein Q8O88_03775 [bacterium]|nr:hypothetical protein [bacterium]
MKDATKYENFKKRELFRTYIQLTCDPLQFLVEEKGNLFINTENKDLPPTKFKFDVIVKSNNKNYIWDCKVENFHLNKWFRTNKGYVGRNTKPSV